MKAVSRVVAVAGFGALLALSSPVKADVAAIRDSNTAYWGSVGAQSLNYKEDVQPIPDSEHGWLPSMAMGVTYMGKGSNAYLSLQGSVAAGDEKYNGALYNESSGEYDIPWSQSTHTVITSFDVKVGKGFVLTNSMMLTPYIDLGFRYWERDLGDEFVEKYHNYEALAGAMIQYAPTSRLVLTGYGAVGAILGAEMKAPVGTFDLGSTAIYKLGAKVGYNLTPRWELFTSLDFDYFRFVRSDVVNGYLEPSSFTTDAALRLGVSYHIR
jgi:hypothetical protein